MPTKDLCTRWYCAAHNCEEKAEWKVLISHYAFVTVCNKHLEIYKRTMAGPFAKLALNEGMTPGWDYIRERYRWRGAYKKGYERKVIYAKRR